MLKIVAVIVCGGGGCGSGNSGGQYTVFFFYKGFAYGKIVNMALKVLRHHEVHTY
jgi:hypothetical protein